MPDDDAIREALRQVGDPEAGMIIVDLGLVYAIEVAPGRVDVEMTMTTAACPMGDMIVGQARDVMTCGSVRSSVGAVCAGAGCSTMGGV